MEVLGNYTKERGKNFDPVAMRSLVQNMVDFEQILAYNLRYNLEKVVASLHVKCGKTRHNFSFTILVDMQRYNNYFPDRFFNYFYQNYFTHISSQSSNIC